MDTEAHLMDIKEALGGLAATQRAQGREIGEIKDMTAKLPCKKIEQRLVALESATPPAPPPQRGGMKKSGMLVALGGGITETVRWVLSHLRIIDGG